jgi:hypothetical protein
MNMLINAKADIMTGLFAHGRKLNKQKGYTL